MKNAVVDKKNPFVEQVRSLPSVAEFLDKINQKSIKTGKTYLSALVKFQHSIQPSYDCETIIQAVKEKKVDEYKLLSKFISYLQKNIVGVTTGTLRAYDAAIKSYLGYHDIFIIPQKYKFRVGMPKNHKEDEEPIDNNDIRTLLNHCTNLRLKAYLMVLASSAMRAQETLSIRYKDLDFTSSPTRIHLRPDYTKTKVSRDIYISDEATKYLQAWLDFKSNHREYIHDGVKVTKRDLTKEDLIFAAYDVNTDIPTALNNLYTSMDKDFIKLLEAVKMNEKKDTGMVSRRRHKITLHSFRRYVKGVLSEQVSTDYSEYFLGHSKSPYWTMKESVRREIYRTKCMNQLTFLDYNALETTGKNIEAKLDYKDKQIMELNKKIATLEDNVDKYKELSTWADMDVMKTIVEDYKKKRI